MAKPPKTPRPDARPQEISVLLRAELRGRGMSEAEIDAALRKRKRAKLLELTVRAPPRAKPGQERQLPPQLPPLRPPGPGRVREEVCNVSFAAEQLGLHPKTVLRFIREGRLPATRIGKTFRILRSDLEAFAGLPARPQVTAEPASLTCIVDVPGVGPELAQAWAKTVPAALNARPAGGQPLRAEVIYEPARSHLKIIVVGAPDDALGLLAHIRIWLEQLTA